MISHDFRYLYLFGLDSFDIPRISSPNQNIDISISFVSAYSGHGLASLLKVTGNNTGLVGYTWLSHSYNRRNTRIS